VVNKNAMRYSRCEFTETINSVFFVFKRANLFANANSRFDQSQQSFQAQGRSRRQRSKCFAIISDMNLQHARAVGEIPVVVNMDISLVLLNIR